MLVMFVIVMFVCLFVCLFVLWCLCSCAARAAEVVLSPSEVIVPLSEVKLTLA